MVQVLAAAITATLAGLGWLISRWVKHDALTEHVDRRLKLIALHQRMTKAGLTLDDLKRLEKELVTGPSGEVTGEKVDGITGWPDVEQTDHSLVIDAGRENDGPSHCKWKRP